MTYPGGPGGQSFGDPGSASRTATVVLNADVGAYTAQMQAAAAQTNQMASSVDTLSAKLSGLDKWVGRKLFHFAAGDFAILGAAAADAATFEKQLSTLAATAAVTGRSMGGLKRGVEDTFTSFSASRGEVVALTEAISNLGVTGDKQITSLTRTFLKLSAATGESSVGLAQGMTQLSRLMGVTDATQIGNMANALLTVSKNAGVSASGVLNFAQAIAPIARQAGIGEAAVLGISSAFSKAGQDGYYAANSFSSMLGDITQLASTGSPDLAKYSNLLGITAEQFKKMPKDSAFTDIVEKLGKQGPAAIATLDRLGLDGVRTQRAFAALSQSGDLRRQIDLALSSQGNQGNLNKGAEAAFNNLADSLGKVRNQFTELGTIIGTTFLRPLALVADMTGKVTHGLTGMLRPVAGVLGGTAAGAGIAAALGGAAMSAAGIIGTVALAHTVTRGMFGNSMRAGFSFERNGLAAVGTRDRVLQERAQAGELGMLGRFGYYLGGGTATAAGAAGLGGGIARFNPRTLRNMALTAPGRMLDAFNAMNTRFLLESQVDSVARERMRANYPRLSLGERLTRWSGDVRGLTAQDALARQIQRSVRFAGEAGGAYTRTGISQAAPLVRTGLRIIGPALASQTVGAFAGSLVGMPHMGTYVNEFRRMQNRQGMPENWRAAGTAFISSTKTVGTQLAAVARGSSGSFRLLGMAAKTAAIDLKNLSLQGTGAMLGSGLRAGYGATASVMSAGWGLAKGIGRAAFSPLGLIGITAGMYGMHKFNEAQKAGDVDNFLNPIQKYNNLLGTTTTNLASFNNALVQGAAAAAGAGVSSYDQAATVSMSDLSAAPNKPVNDFWTDLKNNLATQDMTGGLAAALASLPITDPKQLQAAKLDMLAAGISQADVSTALSQYMSRGGPDKVSGLGIGNLRLIGQAVANSEGNGYNWTGDMSKSQSGGRMLGLGLSGIDSQRVSDESQVGGLYARQKALKSYIDLLGPLTYKAGHGSSQEQATSMKALADALHKITGGDEDTFKSFMQVNTSPSNRFDRAAQGGFLEQVMGSTDEGKRYLAALGPKGTTQYSYMNSVLGDLMKSPDDHSFNGLLLRSGALGKFAATDKTVQAAIGSNQGTPGYVDESVRKLAGQATALTGGFSGAAAELEKLKGAIGDTTSALYKQAQAAQQLVLQLAAYRAPYQTRGERFGQAVSAYQSATKAYYAIPEGQRPAEADYLKPTRDAYEAALAEQQGYLQSMYQTAQQYGIQMERAAEDENIQVARSKRNFNIQMLQAQQDFNKQMLRAEQDHATALKNQSEQTAQSIYNPYVRIAAQYTSSVGSTIQNLQDQNAALAKQQAEVNKLKQAGLSTHAIQTLDLMNPANAQQTQRLFEDMLSNPNTIAKVNKLISTRLKDTKAVTQNPFVLSFQQGEAEFHRQLDRAHRDYQIAIGRAQDQQAIALGDMADDYKRTVERAGEDLTLAMTEVTGTFGSMYDKTMGQIAASVRKFSPQAAAQMRADLQGLVAEFPFLKGGDASQLDINGPLGSIGNPVTTAFTMGVNAHGKIGYYDDRGKFHADPNAPVSSDPSHIAAPEGTGHHRKHHHRHHGQGAGDTGRQPGVPQAAGGITIGPQVVPVSEWAANARELHIPLNRGDSYFKPLADSVSRTTVQTLMTAGRGIAGSGSGNYHYSDDHSTNFSGDINVSAADLRDLLRQLDAKTRLGRLTSPRRR